GPVPVTEKVLRKAGMTTADIDLWELNEAFASVVLRYMQAFDIPHDKINVNGGAIALGHPLGATGAMILGTVLDELERSEEHTSELQSHLNLVYRLLLEKKNDGGDGIDLARVPYCHAQLSEGAERGLLGR